MLICSACSQFSNGLTSRSWHNLNSRFNALLIAREDIEVAQEFTKRKFAENYEDVLPVFRPIDSTSLDTAKFYLVDAIKKASLIAEKHSNSKYLDEAYLLIGEARIYKGEFENAIETYKYLNTVAASEEKKTAAMTGMLRAYTELGDFKNADQLSNLLKNRPLDKANLEAYLLNMAYYHQMKGEDAFTIAFLEEALKRMKKGDEKARYHYLLGQLYQNLGETLVARQHYKAVLKNKPNYDLIFHSNLGLMSTESLAHNTDLQFSKMLEDRKNQDLLHKIYYKMGETARRKKDSNGAINYFGQSVAYSGADKFNKGLAYSAIADVYLEDFLNYEKAAAYYDSTVITLPKDYVNKTDILEKSMYLNEFIKYKKVYDLEDSLQRLAALKPEVLDQKLEEIVKAKRKVDIQTPKDEQVYRPRPTLRPKWRLYDGRTLSLEKNEFVRLWGNRKLEDNWRRQEKSNTTFVFSETERKMVEQPIALAPSATPEPGLNQELNEAKIIEEEVKELKKRIPTTKIQQIASRRKQEEAAFRIAKIYKQKFRDEKKADESFKQFLEQFPKSSYEPEVLYFLALSQSNPLQNQYAQRLLKEYPMTSFGRQMRKGSVVMTQDREVAAQRIYQTAYSLYESGKMEEALKTLEEGMNEYVGSHLEDKMALLRIYALAKLGAKDEYQIALTDFVRSYPSSELLNKAREMLAVLN
ncbi:tetratricopeptide repeat protein [Leadbetterella byssophila]|uniref:type IX secretion system periplasmic lipoprotein PorW/SprE n=1 Tax=Leadbetterella byssophila TaxID=316068 RepID=UPI00399FD312